MTGVFADTSYYVALLLKNDSRHARAVHLTAGNTGPVLTTSWVLSELGRFLSPPPTRQLFVDLVKDLQGDAGVIIADANTIQFNAGLEIYASRSDKAWSLVDCISFLVMRDKGLSDAWTTDHHFEQAGFHAMLK
jgi:predicted nucleic acid-binding protein